MTMKIPRRAVWAIVGALALATLGTAWFLQHFERERYEARTAPDPAALRDPWLAAERLLQRLGFEVHAVQEAAAIDALPPGGALVLSSDREYHLTPARTATLLSWVSEGGYLIADASGVAASDPILRAFDVRLAPPRRTERVGDSAEDDARDALPVSRSTPRERAEPPRRAVGVPGYGRVLRMRAIDWSLLYAGDTDPAWRTPGPTDRAGNHSDEILEYAHGRGHVTLINGLWRFRGTRALEYEDHAEILTALLATHHVDRRVLILTRLTTPTLFEWLADHAAAALLSAALLIAFWLWRVIPRFGVPRPPPSLSRRSLVQHLRAMGRFLWRQRAGDVMMDAARANVRRRLAQRGIASAALPVTDLAAATGTALGVPTATVVEAFGGPARTPDAFRSAMATLADLDHRLDQPRTS